METHLPYSRADTPLPQRNLRRRQNVAFATVGAILLVAALGLNLGVQQLGVVFRKERVDPVQPVAAIGTKLGGWIQVGQDRKIESAVEETLGTDVYVMRIYLNYGALSEAERAQFDAATPAQQGNFALQMLVQPEPKAIQFSFTYYTGLVDSVPHIPERCFVAGGFMPVGSGDLAWPGILPDQDLSVRYLDFEEQASSGFQSHTRNVAYLFSVNGQWKGDVESVRRELQNLTLTKSYFAKIELMTATANPAAAQATMQDFLRNAIPSIETVLPLAEFQPSGSAMPDAPAAQVQTDEPTKVETL